MSFSGQAAKAPPARSSVNSMALQTLSPGFYLEPSLSALGQWLMSPPVRQGWGTATRFLSEALLFCAPVAVSSPTAFFFFLSV